MPFQTNITKIMASTDYPLMQCAHFNRFCITDVAMCISWDRGKQQGKALGSQILSPGFVFLGGGHHHLAVLQFKICKHLEM